jgi:methyltransferase of ATP-grasp peptide maturase system
MSDELSERRHAFVSQLAAQGCLKDRLWQAAFWEVPRHHFLPAFFVQGNDGRWRAIDASHPDYFPLVYADTTLTTQVHGETDPDPAAEPVLGDGTSSSTQPSLMACMLAALDLTGSERVLEIGTGTGYNAALLSHRLGDERVTTIEVDPHVTSLARDRLKSAGYSPTVETADGETGWSAGAPYDRVIATVSFPFVPRAWIDQTRDGGHIVTSLWRDLGGGPLVRLTVNDGVAEGRFLAEAGGFMPTRAVSKAQQMLSTAMKQNGPKRHARIGSEVLHEANAGMMVALTVTDATWIGFTPDGGTDQLWLFSSDGSWSCLEDASMTVEQHGSRQLWDEVEAAYQRWLDAGSPNRERVGLTVTTDGAHRFWLDSADRELWSTSRPS